MSITKHHNNIKLFMRDKICQYIKLISNIKIENLVYGIINSILICVNKKLFQISQLGIIKIIDYKTVSIELSNFDLIDKIQKSIIITDMGFNIKNHKNVIVVSTSSLTYDLRKRASLWIISISNTTKIFLKDIRKKHIKEYKKTSLPKDEIKYILQNIENTYVKNIAIINTICKKKIKEFINP